MAALERSAAALSEAAHGHGHGSECWTEALYADDIARQDRSWWVCYQDDELAGFAGGQLLDGQMQILNVVVGEPYRRQGIARRLLMHLAGDAKELGATRISLEVRAGNAVAQSLYASLGLEETGRRKRYYPPREDAIIMTGSVEAALARGNTAAPQGALTHDSAPMRSSALQEASHPLILAIESSCDETAAALINGKGRLLSNVIASQASFHARFGGVVPEIASRKHTEAIYPVVMEAMGGHSWHDLNAVAVTYAPGLIGALVVGMAFAKGLCWATGLSLIKVNHLEGHVYANRFVTRLPEAGGEPYFEIDTSALEPPFIVALLSGGNTLLVYVRGWGAYEILGETLDDAIGEAYDKVAKALGLGYPGGPAIARLATEGNPRAVSFPRALLHSGDYRFSYSGLKTAVLTAIREQEATGTLNPHDIAASFEEAVIEVQVAKALKACESLGVRTFCIGGGVAANAALRRAYQAALEPRGIRLVFPPHIACTDNAAMIAAVALDRYCQGCFADLSDDATANADMAAGY
jgi:N6-L-threonylcarbamoyladenine synthase